MLITAKIFYHQPSDVELCMWREREEERDSWWDCSAEGFENSGVSSSFLQWSVRLRPTNTKSCVLNQDITYYWGTGREGRGFKRGNRETEGKERARKGWVPALPPECPSQIPPSFPSSLPSILPPPLCPAAGQFLFQQRKTPLMAQTERSVCVRRTESLSLSKFSMNSHYILLIFFSVRFPFPFVSFWGFFLFFFVFSVSSVLLWLLLSLLSPVTSYQPSSPVLIYMEWLAAETIVAVLPGRSICADMEHLQQQLAIKARHFSRETSLSF